jgi:subtilase family serine protease
MNSATTPVAIPAGTPAGVYYILAKADADNAIGESQEGNNVTYVTIRVTTPLASLAPTLGAWPEERQLGLRALTFAYAPLNSRAEISRVLSLERLSSVRPTRLHWR